MGQLFLVVFGVLLLAAALGAVVEGLLKIGAILLGGFALVSLYRLRPMLFYAVCIVGAGALLPAKARPLLGLVLIVWVGLEIGKKIYQRARRTPIPPRHFETEPALLKMARDKQP